MRLDRAAVERRLAELTAAILAATGVRYAPLELANGFLRVANANMVRALRSVSVVRGCDPRDYVLVPFGGAAGQHACALAEELGIGTLLLHPDAGLLSARGIGLADHRAHRVAPVEEPYCSKSLGALEATFTRLEREAADELIATVARSESDLAAIDIHRRLDLRYRGIEQPLTIERPADGDYSAAFRVEHEKLYGYVHSDRPLEIVAARVEAVLPAAESLPPSTTVARSPVGSQSHRIVTVHFSGRPHDTHVFERSELQPGNHIVGPAVVLESSSTTVVDPGWQAEVLSGGELLTTRCTNDDSVCAALAGLAAEKTRPDPVLLEIFNNHFAGIAEQMGITLCNTAGSVNVKERLDFSCALF